MMSMAASRSDLGAPDGSADRDESDSSCLRSYTFDWDVASDVLEHSFGQPPGPWETPGRDRGSGREWFAQVHPLDRERYRGTLRELAPASRGYLIRYRRGVPGGGQVLVEEQGRGRFDGDGRLMGVMGVGADQGPVPDPDHRLRALDRALARERELLARILDRIPVMITVYDPNLQEFRVNREFERVLGWSSDELRGRDVMAVFYPDPVDRAEVRRFMTPPREGWADFRVTARDGTIVDSTWANVRLSDETQVGIGIDIRDRKRAERALRESEERFRLMAETVPDILFTTDADGYCDYCNPRFYEYTGLPPETAGLAWMEAVHPDDREGVQALWRRSREGGEQTACSYRLRGADGAWRWFQARVHPVRDADGRVTRWFGVVTDIHEVQSAREALEAADRRKNEFLAMLGHELRNPMAPIRSAVDAMGLIGVEDPHLAWALGVIDRQSRHMSRLLDDLLDVSRIIRGKLDLRRQPVSLRAFVEDALEEAAPALEERGHRPEVALPAEPVTVDGDPVRLSQILVNLLTNAAKYTPAGGRIALSAEAEGREVVVRVRDTGQGMSAELMAHVFEAFHQGERSLDRAPGGLGLGLTIASRLAEMHGGRLEAESAGPGLGSEFRLLLPRLMEAAERPASAPGPAARPDPARVLVVDDSPDVARGLSLLLGLMGYEVRTAGSGAEALELTQRWTPQAVLLGIGMDGIDGLEVARRLRRACPDHRRLRLIAVTGYGGDDFEQETRAAGFDHHISKPAERERLEEVLRGL